jgi:hypothetical protein
VVWTFWGHSRGTPVKLTVKRTEKCPGYCYSIERNQGSSFVEDFIKSIGSEYGICNMVFAAVRHCSLCARYIPTLFAQCHLFLQLVVSVATYGKLLALVITHMSAKLLIKVLLRFYFANILFTLIASLLNARCLD